MAYYTYSVKERLAAYFGDNTLSAMRRPHDAILEEADRQNILPLSWQYADEQTRDLFLEHRFLIDTSVEEDYIAYRYQEGERQGVFLMFMLHEENAPFSIDTAYACEIIRKWQAAGYDAGIVSQCVCVENYAGGRFRFGQHSDQGLGTYDYRLVENGGRELLVFDTHDCWTAYYEKLAYAAASPDFREYECLFEPDVSVVTGEGEDKKTIASGIAAAADFLRGNGPVRACFAEYGNTGIFMRCLMAGSAGLGMTVNARNLITELTVTETNNAALIPCEHSACAEGSVRQVPALLSVRALDITQIHGYAVQLSYADGSIRNYYLDLFGEPQIPDSVVVDGYVFNAETLNSAAIKDNGIFFSNGYAIPSHLLFYRSYRQVQSDTAKRKPFRVGTFMAHSKYLLPLKEFKSFLAVKHYWGRNGECFGPADALLDRDGRRVSEISFYGEVSKWRWVWRVRVEPTGRYGFLTENGSWLAPPVYDSMGEFEAGCAKATRLVNGEQKQFLITEEGREIPFDHEIDTEDFWGGLCRFNAAKETVSAPKPGYYWEQDYDHVKPGRWGYVDLFGTVIVEPQYTYAVGFWNGDGERSVVARMVDGKLLWGVIDTEGKEVIPCRYESVYTRWGDAFAFRRYGETLFGVMDPDGNVIAEPQFEFFEAYDSKHRLLTVGDHEDALGVYSLDRRKMIIPAEYDCIDYGEHIISCEVAYTGKERYFDYDGNEQDFSAYDAVIDRNDLLYVRKGEKFGYIRMDGTVVIPPILIGGMEDNLALYKKGYMLTGDRRQKGLATVDGREILPQEYNEITVYDEFVIASERNGGNRCIRDALFSLDGKPILTGRRMYYDREEQTLTVETPCGTEHFELRAFC